jgi:hypothetical protein
MHRKLTSILRRIKKKIIIHRETRSRGGDAMRVLNRLDRRIEIFNEKKRIREDFMNSWRLGEIKNPTEEERKKIFSYPAHHLTWKFLLDLQKKYWRENI